MDDRIRRSEKEVYVMVPVAKERWNACDEDTGSDLEEPILPLFDELVVVEFINEEPCVKTEVGGRRFKGLKWLSKYPRSV